MTKGNPAKAEEKKQDVRERGFIEVNCCGCGTSLTVTHDAMLVHSFQRVILTIDFSPEVLRCPNCKTVQTPVVDLSLDMHARTTIEEKPAAVLQLTGSTRMQ